MIRQTLMFISHEIAGGMHARLATQHNQCGQAPRCVHTQIKAAMQSAQSEVLSNNRQLAPKEIRICILVR